MFGYERETDGTIKLVPLPRPKPIFAKLVKRKGMMIFELPKGYRLDPEAIGQAVAEERASRA